MGEGVRWRGLSSNHTSKAQAAPRSRNHWNQLKVFSRGRELQCYEARVGMHENVCGVRTSLTQVKEGTHHAEHKDLLLRSRTAPGYSAQGWRQSNVTQTTTHQQHPPGTGDAASTTTTTTTTRSSKYH